MSEVPASEYINDLLMGYQFAEKIYSQCVSDVIAAEIRRDEAKKTRDALLVRLECAREKYGPNSIIPATSSNVSPPKDPAGENNNGRGGRKQASQRPSKIKIANSKIANETLEGNAPVKAQMNSTRPKEATVEEPPLPLIPTASPVALSPSTAPPDPSKITIANKQVANAFTEHKFATEALKNLSKSEQTNEESPLPVVPVTPTSKIKKIAKIVTAHEFMEKAIPAEDAKTPVGSEPQKVETSPGSLPRALISSDILLSPTAGTKKVPRVFLSPGQVSPRRRSSRYVTLSPIEDTKLVLGIAPGRTREWFESNFDCESCGLVKNFYKAAFGTKTNEKTQKVTVRTVVLNDEWNDFVTDTSQIQELFIGKTSSKEDGKPNPRDKAAEALVNPHQKEPVAIFFAPRKSPDAGLVYYGGHWKVVDGKMLNPPRVVKGQTRQCLVKFAFVGVDRLIVEALNKGPP